MSDVTKLLRFRDRVVTKGEEILKFRNEFYLPKNVSIGGGCVGI